jgi:hypothetical protein
MRRGQSGQEIVLVLAKDTPRGQLHFYGTSIPVPV